MEEATAEKVVVDSLKMEESTAEKKVVDSLFKEGEMLKLRKELWDAEDVWMQMEVEAAWGTSKTKQVPPPVDVKKKKKLVRVILPDACVDDIIEDPNMMTELSKRQIAKRPKQCRQGYAIAKIINAKKRAYYQALIDQYHAFGFAYDEVEVEVTDDEEVKN